MPKDLYALLLLPHRATGAEASRLFLLRLAPIDVSDSLAFSKPKFATPNSRLSPKLQNPAAVVIQAAAAKSPDVDAQQPL